MKINVIIFILLVGLLTCPELNLTAGNQDSMLVAHWSFDELVGGKAIDITGNGHDGTIKGNAHIINDSQRGNVASFDGNGDYIEVAHTSDICMNPTGKFTVSLWVKVATGSSGWRGIMNKSRNTGNHWGFWLNPSNQVYIGGVNIASVIITDTLWHHIAFVQDNVSVKFYFDGDYLASGSKFSQTGTGNLWFGGAASVSEWFKGCVDDARIYNRAWSYDEILQLNGKTKKTHVSISNVKPHIYEGSDSVASFKVIRDDSDKQFTIRFDKTLTASPGDVQGVIPDSVIMDIGKSDTIISFKATDDAIVEKMENIKFTIKADTNYLISGRADATIYIHDKEVNKLTINEDEIIDKIIGGWIGQMTGVTWGAPTEFQYQGKIMPDSNVPTSNAINDAFGQDDLYVEIPFINAMKNKGVNCSWTDFGDNFQLSQFALWHANLIGRNNLKAGIAAPLSGHYSKNKHCDDIDWQIEADFAGQVCPGMPMAAIDIAWRGGHVMNYGDGVYGGVFMAAMHAAAFTSGTIDDIINAGLLSIPDGSKFRQVMDDVIAWKNEGKNWKQNWQALQDKWGKGDRCPDGLNNPFNIDAKMNSAYVLMGLLYGYGDLEESMKISMQCGDDSDCNPSTTGGILGNWLGEGNIPDKWQKDLQKSGQNFSYTTFDFNTSVTINLDLAKKVLAMKGGNITNNVWNLPDETVSPLVLEQWPAITNALPKLFVDADTTGNTITFKARAIDTDGIASFQWFFGDLSYASGDSVVHEYITLPENFHAICYVTDSIGNTSWLYADNENFDQYDSVLMLGQNMDLPNKTKLKVFPNPMLDNYLDVEAGSLYIKGRTEFTLYDEFGRMLYRQFLSAPNERIYFSNIPFRGGMYFVTVKSGKGISNTTLVKF